MSSRVFVVFSNPIKESFNSLNDFLLRNTKNAKNSRAHCELTVKTLAKPPKLWKPRRRCNEFADTAPKLGRSRAEVAEVADISPKSLMSLSPPMQLQFAEAIEVAQVSQTSVHPIVSPSVSHGRHVSPAMSWTHQNMQSP